MFKGKNLKGFFRILEKKNKKKKNILLDKKNLKKTPKHQKNPNKPTKQLHHNYNTSYHSLNIV